MMVVVINLTLKIFLKPHHCKLEEIVEHLRQRLPYLVFLRECYFADLESIPVLLIFNEIEQVIDEHVNFEFVDIKMGPNQN